MRKKHTDGMTTVRRISMPNRAAAIGVALIAGMQSDDPAFKQLNVDGAPARFERLFAILKSQPKNWKDLYSETATADRVDPKRVESFSALSKLEEDEQKFRMEHALRSVVAEIFQRELIDGAETPNKQALQNELESAFSDAIAKAQSGNDEDDSQPTFASFHGMLFRTERDEKRASGERKKYKKRKEKVKFGLRYIVGTIRGRKILTAAEIKSHWKDNKRKSQLGIAKSNELAAFENLIQYWDEAGFEQYSKELGTKKEVCLADHGLQALANNFGFNIHYTNPLHPNDRIESPVFLTESPSDNTPKISLSHSRTKKGCSVNLPEHIVEDLRDNITLNDDSANDEPIANKEEPIANKEEPIANKEEPSSLNSSVPFAEMVTFYAASKGNPGDEFTLSTDDTYELLTKKNNKKGSIAGDVRLKISRVPAKAGADKSEPSQFRITVVKRDDMKLSEADTKKRDLQRIARAYRDRAFAAKLKLKDLDIEITAFVGKDWKDEEVHKAFVT